jgi:hypothetical protein
MGAITEKISFVKYSDILKSTGASANTPEHHHMLEEMRKARFTWLNFIPETTQPQCKMQQGQGCCNQCKY